VRSARSHDSVIETCLRLQRRATKCTVARAQFVRLQTVENTQDFLGATAHVKVINRYVLNHVIGIDDEGRAQRHAELTVQFAPDVAERIVVQLVQDLVRAALSHLDELVINAAAEQNRVAVLKVLRRLRELDDLRTADERKALRIEIDFSSTCRRRTGE